MLRPNYGHYWSMIAPLWWYPLIAGFISHTKLFERLTLQPEYNKEAVKLWFICELEKKIISY